MDANDFADSDSSSSTSSWVFVDENNPSDGNAPNRFYLNCSGEPVQELTENDLGETIHYVPSCVCYIALFVIGVVDCDSDSDGISVISETEESAKESSSDEFFASGDVVENVAAATPANFNFQRVVPINENSINLKKLFITSSLIGAGVVVVAILIAPYITPKVDSDTSIDDVGVEMRKEYPLKSNFHCGREHKKRRPNVSFFAMERIHNGSRKYSRRQAFDVRGGDNKKYLENDYQVKYSTYKADDIKHANAIDREGDDDDDVLLVSHNKKSKKRNKENRGFNCADEIRSKEKKLKAKEEYLAKKEEYLIKKEYELLKKKMKLEKYNRKSEKKNKFLHKMEHNIKRENKSDGTWYVHFHKHRDDVRKREHAADWLFDRASERARKRDEARWYFQWMVGREEGRFRRPLRRQHA